MFFECRYCKRLFKKETAFIKHSCKERERHYDLTNSYGQAAFNLYCRWIYLKFKRSEVTYETFKISRFYNAFISFAKYYQAIKGFTNLDEFLLLMIRRDITPSNWLNERVIAYYLNQVDQSTPTDKIKKSLNSIFKICDAYDCDTSMFFDNIEFDVMVSFIKLHKLSPWVLLNSKQFMVWLSELGEEQQGILDNMIDSDKWYDLFQNDIKSLNFAKTCVKELGL